MLRLLGSLRGLRVQLLLWTVLPLTLVLIEVTLAGITAHQQAMREMVAELDARSARLAAAHLSDGLTERAAVLRLLATGPELGSNEALAAFFDAGLVRLDGAGRVIEAVPGVDIWQSRPVKALLAGADQSSSDGVTYSDPFVDPASGRLTVLIGLPLEEDELMVGAASLEQLGLTDTVVQARSAVEAGLAGVEPVPAPGVDHPTFGAATFLVDRTGEIIYHSGSSVISVKHTTYSGVNYAREGARVK